MAIVTSENPSSPSPSPAHFSQPRHFYLAVESIQYKRVTLTELLGVAGQSPCLPIVVCCSSRDELDDVCSDVSSLHYISMAALYSDLAESERARILDNFRHAVLRWNQKVTSQRGDGTDEDGSKSNMIVVTDACLPLLSSGESPLSARVLINYELPTKKEIYMRRMTTCLATEGIVINMVVGGEVVTLRNIEESSNLVIAEMPINISEIL